MIHERCDHADESPLNVEYSRREEWTPFGASLPSTLGKVRTRWRTFEAAFGKGHVHHCVDVLSSWVSVRPFRIFLLILSLRTSDRKFPRPPFFSLFFRFFRGASGASSRRPLPRTSRKGTSLPFRKGFARPIERNPSPFNPSLSFGSRCERGVRPTSTKPTFAAFAHFSAAFDAFARALSTQKEPLKRARSHAERPGPPRRREAAGRRRRRRLEAHAGAWW